MAEQTRQGLQQSEQPRNSMVKASQSSQQSLDLQADLHPSQRARALRLSEQVGVAVLREQPDGAARARQHRKAQLVLGQRTGQKTGLHHLKRVRAVLLLAAAAARPQWFSVSRSEPQLCCGIFRMATHGRCCSTCSIQRASPGATISFICLWTLCGGRALAMLL